MAHSVSSQAYEIVELDKVKNSRHKRNAIIDEGGKDLVCCICDCIKNVLRGNIPVSDEEKQKLKPYRHCLRKLAKKKMTDKKRRQLLQTGGFLDALIPILVTLVGKLFSEQ